MIQLYKGNTSPSLSDTIKVGGVAFDLTGSTVRFRMRAEGSSALFTDQAATIVSAVAGTVRYDWQNADVGTPADYVGWWQVTLPSGKTQDTDEFQIVVLDHTLDSIALCSLYDVREAMEVPDNVRGRDKKVRQEILNASREIISFTGREFMPQTASATRRFRVDPRRNVRGAIIVNLAPYDLRSVTTMKLHPETSAPVTLTQSTDYTLEPEQPQDNVYDRFKIRWDLDLTSQMMSTWGFAYIDIAGAWGWPSIPQDVSGVCAQVVAGWMSRDLASMSVADVGEGVVPFTSPARDLPVFAKRALARYVRQRVF